MFGYRDNLYFCDGQINPKRCDKCNLILNTKICSCVCQHKDIADKVNYTTGERTKYCKICNVHFCSIPKKYK